jgi:hypothetical protein
MIDATIAIDTENEFGRVLLVDAGLVTRAVEWIWSQA